MSVRGPVVVAATLWLVGCGGGSGMSAGVPPSSPSEFCRAYLSNYEAAQLRCEGGLGSPPPNALASQLMTDCALLDDALARGAIAFDSTQALSCLAEIDRDLGGDCEADPPCLGQVVRGLVADGAPCTHWMECGRRGSGCLGSSSLCDPARVCAQVTGEIGDACGGQGVPSCGGDSICDAPVALTPQGKCIAKPAGRPCPTGSSFECLDAIEFCGADGRCKPRFPVGASCADDATGCVLLARCDPGTKTCIAAGLTGQACAGSNQCWFGYCDPSGGQGPVCVDLLPDGAPCTVDWQCVSFTCSAGTCAACGR
jgi:hypothetical protein